MSLLDFRNLFLEEGEEAPPPADNAAQTEDIPEMPPAPDEPPPPPADNAPQVEDIPEIPPAPDEPPPPPDEYNDGGGEQSYYNDGQDENSDESNGNELDFGEKISNILNAKLYQRYLTLLSHIENQLIIIKNNADIFGILLKSSPEIIDVFKKLEENIRIYISDYFEKENYSKNLLFFNKCINLYKACNEILNKNMKKNS